MPILVAKEKPESGKIIQVFTKAFMGIGSCFTLVFGGKRVGRGRVIGDCADDERYTVSLQGKGTRNIGKGMKKVRLELDDD